jgi:hypothetical protein
VKETVAVLPEAWWLLGPVTVSVFADVGPVPVIVTFCPPEQVKEILYMPVVTRRVVVVVGGRGWVVVVTTRTVVVVVG